MATNTWLGATNPIIWSNPADWSNGVPQAGDTVIIGAGTNTPLLDHTTGSASIGDITVANGASLAIKDPGATITIAGNFEDDGGVGIDNTAFDPGGTTVTIGGTLIVTNSGAGFALGNYLQGSHGDNPDTGAPTTTTVNANSVTNTGTITVQSFAALGSRAVLNIASAAGFGGQVGVLTGNLNIGSDGLHAGSQGLVEFASGEINSIASGAGLFIYGPDSFLANATNTTSNSALVSLGNVAGTFTMQAGVSLTLGELTNADALNITGSVNVDTGFLGAAGSHLTAPVGMTISGSLSIGRTAFDNVNSTGSPTVTAGFITGTGTINISGEAVGPSSIGGILNVGSAAGMGQVGVLTANVNLTNNSLLEFASGEITTIASTSTVTMSGVGGFIAHAGATTSNSALTGLTTIDGGLLMQTASPVSVDGALDISHSGHVDLDTGFLAVTGSSLQVATTLTVDGTLSVGRSAFDQSSTVAPTVTAAALAGTGGTINLNGDTNLGLAGTLNVGSAAGMGGTAGLLTDSVNLTNRALLKFASGSITTIAFPVAVFIDGTQAFLANASDTTSNSALRDLSLIAGFVTLQDGALVSTTGGLTIGNGTNDAGLTILNGASVTVHDALTVQNPGHVTIGGGGDTVASTMSANGLTNAGGINIIGNATDIASERLTILGAASNTGAISVTDALLAISGSLSGTGEIDLHTGASVSLGGSVAAGQTLAFEGTNAELVIGAGADFAGTVSGFAPGDIIDFAGRAVSQFGYNGTTATAHFTDGTTEQFALSGSAGAGSLIAFGDGLGGTEIAVGPRGPDGHAATSNFDGHVYDDVMLQVAGSGQLVFANMEAGQFTGFGVLTSPLPGINPVGHADMNGDGIADVIVQVASSDMVLIAEQDGSGSGLPNWVAATSALKGGNVDFKAVGVGDINVDGSPDIILQNEGASGDGSILAVTSGGSSTLNIIPVAGTLRIDGTVDFRVVGVGDVNGDGFADIVLQNQLNGGQVLVDDFHNNNFFTLATATGPYQVVGVGDVNGDGHADVILQQASGGDVIYLDQAGGLNDFKLAVAGIGSFIAKGVADVNNDGFAEVLLENPATGEVDYRHVGASDADGFFGAVINPNGGALHLV